MSKNLTETHVRKYKIAWENQLDQLRKTLSTCNGTREIFGDDYWISPMWGYLNHSRIAQILTRELVDLVDQDLMQSSIQRGVVDRNGLILSGPNDYQSQHFCSATIYDSFNHLDAIALHRLYSAFSDLIIWRFGPKVIDASDFKKSHLRHFLRPGNLVSVQRGFYFRQTENEYGPREVSIRTFKNRCEFRFTASTQNMYGTTSISCSFSGHKTVTALAFVKSLEDKDGKLLVHCSPLAMGIGFRTTEEYINLPYSEEA
ncbi:MAG: hypothetical protein NXH79_07305 [Rhodobacteraceae bacterium]|nr:hypothetical protein [Paracoccaceae bacterium]